MDNNKLILEVSVSTGLTKEQAEGVVNSVLTIISDYVFSTYRGKVEIDGFGSFLNVPGNAGSFSLITEKSGPMEPIAIMKFKADEKFKEIEIKFKADKVKYIFENLFKEKG